MFPNGLGNEGIYVNCEKASRIGQDVVWANGWVKEPTQWSPCNSEGERVTKPDSANSSTAYFVFPLHIPPHSLFSNNMKLHEVTTTLHLGLYTDT